MLQYIPGRRGSGSAGDVATADVVQPRVRPVCRTAPAGFCIYVVHFSAEGDGWRMRQAEVNRDPRQYEETDHDSDARLIAYLIDVLLFHRHVAFPPAGSPRASALANWGVVGRAMMGRHPSDGTS